MKTPASLFSCFAAVAILFSFTITSPVPRAETASLGSDAGIAPAIPTSFGEQLNTIIEDAPNQFANIKGKEIARDLGPLSSFASPEFECKVHLEGARTSKILSDRFGKISFKAEFNSYADQSSATEYFKTLEQKLRQHRSYPFGQPTFTSRNDALGTFLYVEPASADSKFSGLMITLSQMKGMEKVDNRLEQRFLTTLLVNHASK